MAAAETVVLAGWVAAFLLKTILYSTCLETFDKEKHLLVAPVFCLPALRDFVSQCGLTVITAVDAGVLKQHLVRCFSLCCKRALLSVDPLCFSCQVYKS